MDENAERIMTEHNLPVPDDAPWLNLSPEEIQELRNNKRELSEKAREKIKRLINNKTI
jgi:hypothetical protein